MQLFKNFDNVPENYKPDNMHPVKRYINATITDDNVIPLFRDGECEPYGFQWNYGESVSILIKNGINVKLPAFSIQHYEKGFEPSLDTKGSFIGQKLYNLTDRRSWTLTTILEEDNDYVWIEDEQFTYPINGEIDVFLYDDMINKSNIIELRNFRREVVDTTEVAGAQIFTWTLDPEESKEFLSGIYYMYIYTIAEEVEVLDKIYEIVIK